MQNELTYIFLWFAITLDVIALDVITFGVIVERDDKKPVNSTDRFSEPTLFILISLAEGNKHGYAIMEDIENSYDIKIGPGTLYGVISRMEKLKLIEAIPSKDRKKPYQITSEGRQYLQEKLKEIEIVTKLGFERLGLI